MRLKPAGSGVILANAASPAMRPWDQAASKGNNGTNAGQVKQTNDDQIRHSIFAEVRHSAAGRSTRQRW
ncbi:hypothetical protein [Dactylosporangium sp. NPDC050588]|uniref:hypothetical protein n=1 Tax=Dactylosporangium sp. NPDC050588 TaxID=3157211 RepID=UPI0033EA178B